MKLAISTICLNEEKFVDRFMDMAVEADGIFIFDTGSTDKTVEKLRARGATVDVGWIRPWRFDDARNAALAMVPLDYTIVVSVDLDEVFTAGWAQKIKDGWRPETNRLRYQYIWSHHPDGSPATTFWYDKIVKRDTHRWVHPVHEVFTPSYGVTEVQTTVPGFELHHWPDNLKSRGSYLGLLELSVKERPGDDRNAHYYGRELMYYRRYEEAIKELKRHLALPTALWEAERAASMRFIGRCYKELKNFGESERWYLRSCGEAPGEREPWVELADLYHLQRRWPELTGAAERALSIKVRPMSYICDPDAWGPKPYDLASLGCWYSGRREDGLRYGEEALRMAPGDSRLEKNVQLMRSELQSKSQQQEQHDTTGLALSHPRVDPGS